MLDAEDVKDLDLRVRNLENELQRYKGFAGALVFLITSLFTVIGLLWQWISTHIK